MDVDPHAADALLESQPDAVSGGGGSGDLKDVQVSNKEPQCSDALDCATADIFIG